MELTPKTQSVELIKQAQSVLVISHISPDGDSIGSILALRLALEKLGKKVEAIVPDDLDPTYSFLTGYDRLKTDIESGSDLVISVDTRDTGEDLKLGWKRFTDEHLVRIVITPPKGTLMAEDVKIEPGRPKFDLVILLDCADLDRIGKLAEQHQELFYETTTISIDHHQTNTFFAKVNWVDLTATSTSEILVALIESLGRDEPLMDEQMATALLTGLITDTGSFQNQTTTPKSLTVAAQLVAAGADHQKIVEKISSHNLATLRLWGKALARVVEEKEAHFLWTTISAAELTEAGATATTTGLIDKLLKTVDSVDFVLLMVEKETYVNCTLRSVDKNYDVAKLAAFMGGGGHKGAAGFQIEGDLESAQADIIRRVKEFQQNQTATSGPLAPTSSTE